MRNIKNSDSVKFNLLDIQISLYLFEEDEKVVIYSPTLKLQAYGDTEEETLKLFTSKLHLFILEVHNLGRFSEVFEDLGWKVFKSGLAIELDPPSMTELKNTDVRFNEILSTKKFKRLKRILELRTFPEWNIYLN